MVPLDSKKMLKITLETLHSMTKPVGAHKLHEKLVEKGLDISLSSSGRYLLKFEEQGFIEKAENDRGRVLTAKGRKKLASFELYDERSRVKEFFTEFLTETTMENMVDRLIARRGVETEAARFAALNITDEGLNEISMLLNEETILKRHSLDNAPSEEMLTNMAEFDGRFHAAVVKHSGNECLWNFFKLIEMSTKMKSFYAYIAGHKIQEHINIVESLRMRDEEGAAKQMFEHISGVIESCNMYWDAKQALDEYLHINTDINLLDCKQLSESNIDD